MSTFKRLNEVFLTSEEIPFDDESKFVLISDCHRGDGSWVDDFSHNQNLYYSALKYYFNNDFVYIDLGDSDELWKNHNLSDISNIYSDIFFLLHQFYQRNRLYMLFGNHDIEKRNPNYVQKNMKEFYNNQNDRYEPLFEDIKIHEGLILKHKSKNLKIFLIHGHQGDLLVERFWRFSRFLVRHIWRRFELFGLKDPTSAAKNYAKKKRVERKIIEWVKANQQMVIAGHTHRPTFPPETDPPYFNDGSCVHPNCITCIEIENGDISLVKWRIKTKEDRTFFADKEIIAAPRKL